MAYEMVETDLPGFIRWEAKFPEVLEDFENIVKRIYRIDFNNNELRMIGQAVSEDVEHSCHPKTKDGYCWFGELKFTREDCSTMVVLFPRDRDCGHPDRSINVYSDRQLDYKVVRELLERIAHSAEDFDLRKRSLIH